MRYNNLMVSSLFEKKYIYHLCKNKIKPGDVYTCSNCKNSIYVNLGDSWGKFWRMYKMGDYNSAKCLYNRQESMEYIIEGKYSDSLFFFSNSFNRYSGIKFPHIWKDENKAKEYFLRHPLKPIYEKTPLEKHLEKKQKGK